MSINKTEFLTTKKYVTEDLTRECLFDAVAEVVCPAYKELYGGEVYDCTNEEDFVRVDRMMTYATHHLVEIDPSFADFDNDDRCCRQLDCFDRLNAWTYVQEFARKCRVTIESDLCGTWTALEYDFDGDLSHRGVGSSAQEALNAMRMIVPDDL